MIGGPGKNQTAMLADLPGDGQHHLRALYPASLPVHFRTVGKSWELP
jgi:hypothetical protein